MHNRKELQNSRSGHADKQSLGESSSEAASAVSLFFSTIDMVKSLAYNGIRSK